MNINYDKVLKLNKTKFYQSKRERNIKEIASSINYAKENSIDSFEILIQSNFVEKIKLRDKEYLGIVDYRKINDPTLNALVRELWIAKDIINYGDYIKYNNDVYLIRSKVQCQETYDSSYMQICNQVLKFKDINNKVHEIPIIVEKSYPSELDNPSNIVTLDTSRLNCLVGYSLRSSINLIKDYGKNPTRFIMGDKVWKVETVDKSSKMIGKEQGLYVLVLKKVTGCLDDDFENEIAKNIWTKEDVPENPDGGEEPTDPEKPIEPEEENKEIVGENFIYSGRVGNYSIEDNINNLQFEWSIDNTQLATVEKVENGICTVKGDKKNKGYFTVIAKNDDIKLQKRIRVKGFLDE